MTTFLRRMMKLPSTRTVAALALGTVTAMASAGEIVHHPEIVATPPQNVCRGQGCAVNTASYAWHATQWRRWPGTRTVAPSPGRGDRAEPTPAKPAFDIPTPDTSGNLPPTRTPNAGVREPRPGVAAPAAPRTAPTTAAPKAAPPRATTPSTPSPTLSAPPPRTTPDSATGVDTPAPTQPAPPVNLDELFGDEPAAPTDTPETETPEAETPAAEPPIEDIPPPFDSKSSGSRKPRDPRRTLSALSAGMSGGNVAAKPSSPPDLWKAAPVRKVTGERAVSEGPTLNEPNLMSEPGDGPQLQATPEPDLNEGAAWRPSSRAAANEVVPTANWQEVVAETSSDEANPLRATGSAGARRTNPLRRR